jgi:hypothetical protein
MAEQKAAGRVNWIGLSEQARRARSCPFALSPLALPGPRVIVPIAAPSRRAVLGGPGARRRAWPWALNPFRRRLAHLIGDSAFKIY